MENNKDLEKDIRDGLVDYLVCEKKEKKKAKKEANVTVKTGRRYRYAFLRRFISAERERLANMNRILDSLEELIKASNESSP